MTTKEDKLDYIVNALTDIADDLYINYGKHDISNIQEFINVICRDLYKVIKQLNTINKKEISYIISSLSRIVSDLYVNFYKQRLDDIPEYINNISDRLYTVIDEMNLL